MAFAAGGNGLNVGLGGPTHVKAPAFDPKLPGSWLVDLSHVDLPRVHRGVGMHALSSLIPTGRLCDCPAGQAGVARTTPRTRPLAASDPSARHR